MSTKIEILNFLQSHKSLLREKYHISKIALFGSYSRDEATENSDVDLTYEMEAGKTMSYNQFFEMEEYFCQKLKKRVELVNYIYMNPIIKKTAEKDMIYAE